MTLLELVITAHRCRSTHHFIAIDALKLLSGKDAHLWHDLMLRHHEALLKGAKAPDTEFKDFHNHVLHIGEGEWGGARDAAMDWYGRAVAALRAEKWSKAAYALGVLTHYYADPIQPFHTAQTEEEGAIHRAVEWSIAKSRDRIAARIKEMGYPNVDAPTEPGFVSDMVRAGAERSHPHYQTLIDHYDIHVGAKTPEAGLDDTLIEIVADLVAYATAGVAVLFDRAFAEASVKPKKVDLDLPGYLSALDIPIRRITKRIKDSRDRRLVEAMYEELQTTGKVIKTLPSDDKAIRKLHAEQVLRVPLAELDAQPLSPIGVKHGAPMQITPQKAKPAKAVKTQSVAKPAETISAPSEHVADASTAPASQTAPRSEPAAKTEEPAAKATKVSQPDTPERPAALADTPKQDAAEPQPQKARETLSLVKTKPLAPKQDTSETVSAAVLAQMPTPEAKPAPEVKKAPDAKKAEADKAERQQQANKKAAKAEAATKAAEAAEAAEASKARLTRLSPVVDAPSIGPKTAGRLAKVGIKTVGDLMDAAPADAAVQLDVRHIKEATIQDWQDQTGLMLDMPGLRVLDSQILVGAGIRNAADLAKASAHNVLSAATSFLDTPGGSRILWGAESNVDEKEVASWIDLAKSSAA